MRQYGMGSVRPLGILCSFLQCSCLWLLCLWKALHSCFRSFYRKQRQDPNLTGLPLQKHSALRVLCQTEHWPGSPGFVQLLSLPANGKCSYGFSPPPPPTSALLKNSCWGRPEPIHCFLFILISWEEGPHRQGLPTDAWSLYSYSCWVMLLLSSIGVVPETGSIDVCVHVCVLRRWMIISLRAGVTWMSWKEPRTWRLCTWSETLCRRIPSTGAKSCWPSRLSGRSMPRLFGSEPPAALSLLPSLEKCPSWVFYPLTTPQVFSTLTLSEQIVNKKHWLPDLVYNALIVFEMLLLLNLNIRDFLVLVSYLPGRFGSKCLQQTGAFLLGATWWHTFRFVISLQTSLSLIQT